MAFWKSGRKATNFRSGPKNMVFWTGGCPYPNLPPYKFVGETLTSPYLSDTYICIITLSNHLSLTHIIIDTHLHEVDIYPQV